MVENEIKDGTLHIKWSEYWDINGNDYDGYVLFIHVNNKWYPLCAIGSGVTYKFEDNKELPDGVKDELLNNHIYNLIITKHTFFNKNFNISQIIDTIKANNSKSN